MFSTNLGALLVQGPEHAFRSDVGNELRILRACDAKLCFFHNAIGLGGRKCFVQFSELVEDNIVSFVRTKDACFLLIFSEFFLRPFCMFLKIVELSG